LRDVAAAVCGERRLPVCSWRQPCPQHLPRIPRGGAVSCSR